MRMVRCLFLSAVCVAGAVQAQSRPDSSPPDASTGVEVLGLRQAPQLRTSSGLRLHRLKDDQIPAHMEADDMQGSADSQLVLKGNAQVRRIDGIIKGDQITYDRNSGDVDIQGSARILRDGTLITGPSARLNVDTYSGEIEQPNFWIGATGGHAQASHADIFSQSQMRLKQVTFSGCPCDRPAWYIKADTVDLDFDENEGVARSGVLYFKDVPILASPFLSFPIKAERKSGFLVPTYGTTSKSGIDIATPYYFNLAPNYDMTLTPRFLGKRGLQLGGEGRYLGSSYGGILQGTYLPNDREADMDRWMYRWVHTQQFGNGFYGMWDLANVSDDNYFRDMSTLGLNEASTTYLPRRAVLGWSSTYWQSYVQVYKYRTLQDPDAPIQPPLDKQPELFLKGARYDWNGFDAEWTSTAVRFRRPLFLGQQSGAEGDRFQTYPTLAYPIVRPGWFVIPKVGVNYTQYNTNWHGGDWNGLGSTGVYPGTESRTVPIGSVDAGMIFERDSSLFGRAALQTLEPRIYYLRVPYRDQSTLPVYDTTLADFSFAQAFQPNQYVGGWDRISNANQITAGLTTRWLDADSGFERLSLSAAQRIYFEDQRVTLPYETPRENVRSDFLVGASAALTDTLSTDVAAQYNPYDNRWARTYLAARWSPQRLTSISLAYRYQRDPLPGVSYQPRGQNQISLGMQWPFTKRWYGVGRIDYSLRSEDSVGSTIAESPRVTQAIAGVEYKGDCCWTGRVVFQRYAVSAADTNTALFFQLELTGLGALGTDPIGLLNRSIPGYQSVTPRPVPGTSFERYE
ncbi:LPS-assembly protein LptD [Bordetella ansorpii]|nr:LPS-assembly protein LptD [Bordetella ansorpii]